MQIQNSVFTLQLRSGGLAKVTPMKIHLHKTKTPVKGKSKKSPDEECKFLIDYLVKLVLREFNKPSIQVSWQAPPQLVLNDLTAEFQTNIGLR